MGFLQGYIRREIPASGLQSITQSGLRDPETTELRIYRKGRIVKHIYFRCGRKEKILYRNELEVDDRLYWYRLGLDWTYLASIVKVITDPSK